MDRVSLRPTFYDKEKWGPSPLSAIPIFLELVWLEFLGDLGVLERLMVPGRLNGGKRGIQWHEASVSVLAEL